MLTAVTRENGLRMGEEEGGGVIGSLHISRTTNKLIKNRKYIKKGSYSDEF